MNTIIEYIGRAGIKTTDLRIELSRLNNPRPGDVVDFSEVIGSYPFKEQFGTIDQVETGFCDKGEIHVCVHMGSIFLSEGRVSISGGPFVMVKKDDLIFEGSFRMQRMWNWGNYSAGAGNAVYYGIERPVFKLKKDYKRKEYA